MIDKRVYMLTIIAFVVGMAELIIGGILDLVATDLGISISHAGLLISVFSVVFAFAAPVLLVTFTKVERTRLTNVALFFFLIGNIIAVFSPTYAVLIISRIISAASGSLVVVLCINLASNIVEPAYRGRAIGLVVMGISGSLVLGLPIGVILGNMFTWRTPFIVIVFLTVLLMILVPIFMEKVAPKHAIPIRKQLKTLANHKISFTHLTTFFFIAGHYTFYGYLTPYTKTMFGFDGTTISLLYFVFGIAAVSGGGLAGLSADRLGIRKTVLTAIILLASCLFIIPFTIDSVSFFWIVLVIWGVMSWGITPPMQSHLMQLTPETSDIQQSLNNAALHLGIAFGTVAGSLVVQFNSIEHITYFGIIFVMLAFVTAIVSTRMDTSFVNKPIRSN